MMGPSLSAMMAAPQGAGLAAAKTAAAIPGMGAQQAAQLAAQTQAFGSAGIEATRQAAQQAMAPGLFGTSIQPMQAMKTGFNIMNRPQPMVQPMPQPMQRPMQQQRQMAQMYGTPMLGSFQPRRFG
jgi:hypothetical protein